jgi:alkylation response protein AidB-like acyl-CoA dehydrogenase
MPVYAATIKEIEFILFDVMDIAASPILGYSDLDPALVAALVHEVGKISTDILLPLNATGDTEGCRLENGIVRTPDGFKDAFKALREGGWSGIDLPEIYGGQGMPYLMGTIANEIFSSGNQSLAMFQGLTHGAASAILAHGTEAQKSTYLPPMVACEWTGTMNLTEPHCGTDLGLMRTKAVPQTDGSYQITGQKIFISAGDHDLTENIIHLVLARIPGGPDGIKGVSLFIAPKVLVHSDGTLGARNSVTAGKIETKMGLHGNPTCVMNYDGATGYLLGEPHMGMRAMFTMMNEARLGVGTQAIAQAEIAYQNAVYYAKDRQQGRAAHGAQNPADPADPIIVHPDIRRALLDQKSYLEGGRALLLWGSELIDRAHRSQDDASLGLISLLTPVIKGFLSDEGYKMTVKAQQVFGGYGYIEEAGMSQFTRDARITMIYEGANGVQALDLVGRKLGQEGGRHIRAFIKIATSFIDSHKSEDAQFEKTFTAPLAAALKDLQSASIYFMQHAPTEPNTALAGSYDFMHLFGHTCMGLMWARMGWAAHEALKNDPSDAAFYKTKLTTGRYYMSRRLPATALHLQRIKSGGAMVMALAEADF